MSITTFDDYVNAAFNRPQAFFAFPQATVPALTGTQISWWTSSGYAGGGIVPPTGGGEAVSNTTQGSLSIQAPTGGRTLYLGPTAFTPTNSSAYFIHDRIVHTSGLDATLPTSQPVNTVALPARAGTGVGILAALEVYSLTGASAVTATVTYTNSSGIPGRTSVVSFQGNLTTRFMPISLAAGDVGVQSVQSVQLSGSTGGAGNFGVTLFKPLVAIPSGGNSTTIAQQSVFDQGTPAISSNSAIFFTSQSTVAHVLTAWSISFVEGLWILLL